MGKFCQDCRHVKTEGVGKYDTMKCVHPQMMKINPLTGGSDPQYASTCRSDQYICGPHAELFQPHIFVTEAVQNPRSLEEMFHVTQSVTSVSTIDERSFTDKVKDTIDSIDKVITTGKEQNKDAENSDNV